MREVFSLPNAVKIKKTCLIACKKQKYVLQYICCARRGASGALLLQSATVGLNAVFGVFAPFASNIF